MNDALLPKANRGCKPATLAILQLQVAHTPKEQQAGGTANAYSTLSRKPDHPACQRAMHGIIADGRRDD